MKQNEDLIQIPDIGPEIADSVTTYFSNESNQHMLEELKNLGLTK